MADARLLLDAGAIQRSLTRIAHEIAEANANSTDVGLIGIQRGGVHLAGRLTKLLGSIWGHNAPAGVLDVSMHRDDIGQRGIVSVQPTEVPFDVEGKTIVLVDDVLFNGRTVRAALDAVHHLGRPRRIQLAVLVDRGHRELPIKPDYVGKNIPTAVDERIEVFLNETGGNDSVMLQAVPSNE
ncbi:MAG: bifunctional pyr operon transcriptional regulator/uracil phosphoribosyltransferase PyrR [Verrucomicrobiota bacterium]|jgi:pyrimidine operon attenuation protein/uracil phosphoribosyltransferase|nr:bifunctional pyr operon transcriptional regulator/uracil phosphoribosyltransferase PyrR [Verrucomicrobiota bacterium]